jgi:SAM-dependent methyltransferase
MSDQGWDMTPFADLSDPVRYYEQDAEDFALRYNSVTFEAVHPRIDDSLPPVGSHVLDVGAGSGRDARALRARGYEVVAAEPSASFREHGADSDPAIRWVDDRLPDLAGLRREDSRFAFVLCSAVLMLVTTKQIAASFAAMAELLDDAGRLAVSLRDPVDGEPAALFHAHSNATVLGAAASAGLATVDEADLTDALGRSLHRWRSFIFAKRAT